MGEGGFSALEKVPILSVYNSSKEQNALTGNILMICEWECGRWTMYSSTAAMAWLWKRSRPDQLLPQP